MITADELRANRDKDIAVNHTTYKQIYEELSQSVRHRCLDDPRQVTTAVSVPAWVPSRPPFRLENAVKYVKRKFEIGGFQVYRGASDDVLILDWGNGEGTGAKKKKKDGVTKKIEFTSSNPTVIRAMRTAAASKW